MKEWLVFPSLGYEWREAVQRVLRRDIEESRTTPVSIMMTCAEASRLATIPEIDRICPTEFNDYLVELSGLDASAEIILRIHTICEEWLIIDDLWGVSIKERNLLDVRCSPRVAALLSHLNIVDSVRLTASCIRNIDFAQTA